MAWGSAKNRSHAMAALESADPRPTDSYLPDEPSDPDGLRRRHAAVTFGSIGSLSCAKHDLWLRSLSDWHRDPSGGLMEAQTPRGEHVDLRNFAGALTLRTHRNDEYEETHAMRRVRNIGDAPPQHILIVSVWKRRIVLRNPRKLRPDLHPTVIPLL